MGKKSRLKRERRATQKKPKKTLLPHEIEFCRACNEIKALFAHYSAYDVITSLNISDLWLPNISSQVKHILAFSISVAMNKDSFEGEKRIETYSDFKHFLEQLYAVLPSFPMLEDYMPEQDWGEVSFLSKGVLLKIFYGGVVERISDFITAFNLIHGSGTQASQDMHLALLLQDHILTSVEPDVSGDLDRLPIGYIEIPTEIFWKSCRDALISLAGQDTFAGISPGLIIKLGALTSPAQYNDFGDAVMKGSALPAFFVDLDTCCLPLASRNSASNVIEYWADKEGVVKQEVIADFVSSRFQRVIKGPFKIISCLGEHPFIFSAAILSGENPYLIITLDKNNLSSMPRFESILRQVVSSGDWGLRLNASQEVVQIRKPNGALPTIDQLAVIVVLSHVSTVTGFLKPPKLKARILPFPDFITIFDSAKNIEELDRYWAFVDANAQQVGRFAGPVDFFAAFRDSNSLLVDGAVTPSMITLDPHWGTSWRYRMVKEYWDNAPPSFPEQPENTAWISEKDEYGLYKLTAKNIPALCWSSVIGKCTVHFLLVVGNQPIGVDDGRVLELLIHCLADSLNQRKSILSSLPLFDNYRQILTTCYVQMDSLASQGSAINSKPSLFEGWKTLSNITHKFLHISVEANIQRVHRSLSNAIDATFEVEVLSEWIKGASSIVDIPILSKLFPVLEETSSRKPRFMMKVMDREVDIPQYASPLVPNPEHYKIARRDLAITFKALGANEGQYELAEAKKLIDPARDQFRNLIHSQISILKRDDLIYFCVGQLDELIAEYDREKIKINMSLSHEVEYDRTARLAEAYDHFVKDSRNYRYLLECSLSMPTSGSTEVTNERAIQLIASIDWLMVLFNASDVLHNGLDVAGLKLDNFFIPHIYYSDMNEARESEFANEIADFKLGMGLNPNDEVKAIRPEDPTWKALGQAFKNDTGVSLNDLISGLLILSRWPSATKSEDLSFVYSASVENVCETLVGIIGELNRDASKHLLSLITLDPKKIRRLLGKSQDEGDVPIWEHNKRGDRFTIKPVILGKNGIMHWGAASAERAARIWQNTFASGYMPADFDWPEVKEVVRGIKSRMEKRLETKTAEILSRATPYVAGGVDFMRRFPNESFEDVGDFDGLAYWPETNQWLIAECKYNQPVFCLKDGRRLRDRIFGTPTHKSQFTKIERRRFFFNTHLDQLRLLLGWPSPQEGLLPITHEIYVSLDIYWWMRNPPYLIPTHFVRVDGLDNWLRNFELLK